MLGKGPIQEILRIGENFYQLTAEGGLEIIVNIGSKECFYMKKDASTICGMDLLRIFPYQNSMTPNPMRKNMPG